MGQHGFFDDFTPKLDTKYTSKIKAPVYEPKNVCPHILELFNTRKTDRLIQDIKNSKATEYEKQFLIEAAHRHTKFSYSKIADYYSHASKEVQELIEQSALVIIDFDKAIEYGYIQVCTEISKQYLTEYGE